MSLYPSLVSDVRKVSPESSSVPLGSNRESVIMIRYIKVYI